MSNWQHHPRTYDELKELIRDVYDSKIFTSLHLSEESMTSMTSMVFMPLLFMGASPSFPSETGNKQRNRKNKLVHINDIIEYEKETPAREEYLKNIGMVYEYYDKAGPRSINGYPIFMSMKILSIDDTKKFRDMYFKYEEMRKEFEKNWK